MLKYFWFGIFLPDVEIDGKIHIVAKRRGASVAPTQWWVVVVVMVAGVYFAVLTTCMHR